MTAEEKTDFINVYHERIGHSINGLRKRGLLRELIEEIKSKLWQI